MSGGAQFNSHPVRFIPNFESCCIPIGVHGDATPASGAGKSWAKMIDVWSWTSLLSTAPPRFSMFLIWCIHSCLRSAVANHVTLDVAFKMMVWSFEACFTGMHPMKDWNNNKLRGAKATPYTYTLMRHTTLLHRLSCIEPHGFSCL